MIAGTSSVGESRGGLGVGSTGVADFGPSEHRGFFALVSDNATLFLGTPFVLALILIILRLTLREGDIAKVLQFITSSLSLLH